jgi:hypothetical protein
MASLASYGMCQTACNAAGVSCYTSAGFVFGTVTAGAGIPAVIVTCNSILGVCMSVCATKFLAEGSAEAAASGGIMGPVLAMGGIGIVFWNLRRRGTQKKANNSRKNQSVTY